jgi:DNA-binding response OmpR family regulator
MEGGKVLVVDDERFFLTILGDFVTERLSMHPVLVQDGAAALSALGAESVELVLLDIIMPGMDGIEVLRGIKGRRPDLPVIMVTATSAIEHAIAALREGAEDFVRKPVDLDALARAVDHVLRKGEVKKLASPKDVSRERRRATRVRMRAEAPAQLHLMEVTLVDLSLSGALVEHTEPVRPGEIYRLSFPVNGQEVHVLARAVRAFASHRVTVAGGERKVVYRTGMEFVGVDKSSGDAIATYVNRFVA